MRVALLVCLALAAPTARADECDALAAAMAASGGARKAGRRIGPNVEIRTANGVRLDLTCRGPDPIVQAASSEPQPSPGYFADLARAGRLVVDDAPGAIDAALANAYATALRTRTKSFIQQNGWSASCYTDETGSLRTLCSIGRIPRG